MKFWMIFLLFAFITDAKAGIQHTTGTVEEDGPKSAYRPEPSDHLGSAALTHEELEDAPNTVVTVSDVAGGPPGGGLLRIDPKLIKPKDPPPSWWQWIASFF
jgi:hypothetical protein